MTTDVLETTEHLRRATTETKHTTINQIPAKLATMRRVLAGQFYRQRTVTGTGYILAQLLFVRREDAHAAPAPRDRHVPLLRVGRGLDGRVGEQHIIHCLAL